MNTRKYKAPPPTSALNWTYPTLSSYYDDFSMMYSHDGKPEIAEESWQNFFVKHIDYISNNSIEYKNQIIITAFLNNNLYAFASNNTLCLKALQAKIRELMNECYGNQELKGLYDRTTVEETNEFFDEAAKGLDDKDFYVHEEGMEVDISGWMTKDVVATIDKGNLYIGTLKFNPFRLMKLTDIKAKVLEVSTNTYNKIKMPRLDQLLQFRHVYKQMPDDLKVLLERGLLDQAYFLYVYAMDTGWRFLVSMEKALKPYPSVIFKGEVKTNLKRISQNIIETVMLGEGES